MKILFRFQCSRRSFPKASAKLGIIFELTKYFRNFFMLKNIENLLPPDYQLLTATLFFEAKPHRRARARSGCKKAPRAPHFGFRLSTQPKATAGRGAAGTARLREGGRRGERHGGGTAGPPQQAAALQAGRGAAQGRAGVSGTGAGRGGRHSGPAAANNPQPPPGAAAPLGFRLATEPPRGARSAAPNPAITRHTRAPQRARGRQRGRGGGFFWWVGDFLLFLQLFF